MAHDAWNPFGNSTDNNGNVLRQLHYVPLSGGGYVLPQLDDYTYDELNRIKSVTEAQLNSSGGWTFNLFTQNFNYDRWGNRTVSCSPCQPGVTNDVFTIDTSTNRITAKNGNGMTYDLAGNQTYDATGNRWFDGENRMHKATQGGTTSHYVYDADGKRVRRIIGSTETWMIYGVDGELVAEYAAAASASSPQKEYGYRSRQMLIAAETSPLKITWLVTDHLGTPRMNVRGTGTDGGSLASVTRHDYLPFGEDLIAGIRVNGGSGQHGYEPPTDGVRQKFGSKERDNETGLDYFGARYFTSVQGRFTSPDDFLNDTHPADPASWNLYTYVRNNPLAYIDPDGEEVYSTNLTDEQKKQLIKDWQNKTGYKKIYFDKSNKLTIDTAAGFKGGSARARNELLTAATSTSKIFNLRAVSGAEARQVAFADNRGTMVSTDANGTRSDTYETRIDFGDFKQLKGDKDAKKAFTVGIALIHEFEHGLHEGSPTGTDSPRYPGFPGWLETLYINPIRAELGLARRLDYSATLQQSGKNAGSAEVRFRNNKGTVKILRWQDSVVGGKHQ